MHIGRATVAPDNAATHSRSRATLPADRSPPRHRGAPSAGRRPVWTIWKRCPGAASSTTVVSASGKQPHDGAVRRVQRNHVVAPPFHQNRRKRAAAGARLGIHHDAVAQVVPYDRLHAIGEVGEQHGMRRLRRAGIGRYAASTGSSSTQSALTCSQPSVHPYAMLMHSDAPYSLTTWQPNARSISAARRRRQAFAARPQVQRPDLQPSRVLLFGEQREHRRDSSRETWADTR